VHQHHETVLGHLHHAAQFAFVVLVFNRLKIEAVEFSRTIEVVIGAQHVVMPLAEVTRQAQRIRHQPVAFQTQWAKQLAAGLGWRRGRRPRSTESARHRRSGSVVFVNFFGILL
jgi:hypothetical protein